MAEVKPQDYTTGELTSAANICRDAVELLTPAADELMRIAGEVELVEEELHFARTSRHLNAAALHLKISETTIRRIIKNVGRTYEQLSALFTRITTIASLAGSTLFMSWLVLPEHVARIIMDEAPLPFAFAMGMATANVILHCRTRRLHRDP